MATASAQPTQITLPSWYRALAIIVGVISISIGITCLVYPGLALWLVVFLLGFFLLVIGIDRIITGATGRMFGWSSPTDVMGGAPPSGGSAPPK